MKRIYITAVPLQTNFTLEPTPAQPVNYTPHHVPRTSAYPIVPVIEDTVQPGDEVKVIAVRQKNDGDNQNFALLQTELDALALPALELVDLTVPENQQKNELLSLFGRLIDQTESDACYYACATFGTKTYPLVLFSALRFADKLLDNTEIKGIYYREVLREGGQAKAYRQYDISALFTLDSIVDLASANGVSDPKTFAHLLLNPGQE